MVTLIQAESPAADTLGLGDAFRHEPSHNPEASARHFWLQPSAGRIWGPITVTTRHLFADLDLMICYPLAEVENKHALALAMVGDYETLSEAMITPSNWNQGTSTIQLISNGETTILPYAIEDTDARRFLVISFSMRYKTS